MPRRAKVAKRHPIPDAKYNSITVAKFLNRLMLRGQKATAERVLYGAMEAIEAKTKRNPLETLEQAIKNATPLLAVKPRRVGGATYQVPVEVRPERGLYLSTSWLVRSARARAGKSMAEKLAAELVDATQGQGASVKKKEDTHKMAEANRAFVHYRW